jgi:hypothetical protein
MILSSKGLLSEEIWEGDGTIGDLGSAPVVTKPLGGGGGA